MAEYAGQAQAYRHTQPRAGCSPGMDDQQFAQWTQLLESRFGLFIAPERRSFLASGIRSRMRETGCQDYADYYRYLSSDGLQAREWSLLVDCLTVHETCFFRHEASMKLVEDKLLPDAFERERNFHAWSVGCATGEEAYSLAMLIDSVYSAQPAARFYAVTGTDISLPSLHHARQGIYLKRRLRDIPGDLQRKYCAAVTDTRFQVSRSLRKRVCFTQLNLRDVERAPFADLDLIYCQNLLIYYERERRLQVVNLLAHFLRPGGLLVLGPGELLEWRHPGMEKVRYEDTLAYRRAD